MATFRQHHTGDIRATTSDDETAEYEADPLWQRVEDEAADREVEQSLDDIIEQLGYASAEHRNRLREALAQFDDADQLPTGDPFDPSAHSVAEVNDYLVTADLDETTRVLAAEAAGKGRAGIVTGPHAGQNPA